MQEIRQHLPPGLLKGNQVPGYTPKSVRMRSVPPRIGIAPVMGVADVDVESLRPHEYPRLNRSAVGAHQESPSLAYQLQEWQRVGLYLQALPRPRGRSAPVVWLNLRAVIPNLHKLRYAWHAHLQGSGTTGRAVEMDGPTSGNHPVGDPVQSTAC